MATVLLKACTDYLISNSLHVQCELLFVVTDTGDRAQVYQTVGQSTDVSQSSETRYRSEGSSATFSLLNYLREHQRIRDAENYKCEFCGMLFTTVCYLGLHQRVHATDDKPYKCLDCNKAFSQKAFLARHQVIRTGETPHQCDHCDKSFKCVDKLTDHLRNCCHGKRFSNHSNAEESNGQCDNRRSDSGDNTGSRLLTIEDSGRLCIGGSAAEYNHTDVMDRGQSSNYLCRSKLILHYAFTQEFPRPFDAPDPE